MPTASQTKSAQNRVFVEMVRRFGHPTATGRRLHAANLMLETQLCTIVKLRRLLQISLDRRRPMTVKRANHLRMQMDAAVTSSEPRHA
jgi:hypothetical protein